ncbi:MAG: hypothetical protein MH252_01605 [Thermosynechococcaceae cyanobacterium MS004]|nr:hypothetical protein [Thermosynechococcaceae cyanobacterium MS004]
MSNSDLNLADYIDHILLSPMATETAIAPPPKSQCPSPRLKPAHTDNPQALTINRLSQAVRPSSRSPLLPHPPTLL